VWPHEVVVVAQQFQVIIETLLPSSLTWRSATQIGRALSEGQVQPLDKRGVLGMVCQEIILFVAAVVLWKSLSGRDSLSHRAALIARWTFGLCSVDFGLGHLTAIETVVPMIPQWIPLGPTFWAVLTGIAFVLAGLAIVSGVLDVLAAKLLGLMLLVFSALALVALIFASPRDHASWGASAYNPTAVGTAWIVAEWLAGRQRLIQHGQGATPVKPSLA